MWSYNISESGGNQLRDMIQESDGGSESLAAILEQVQACCKTVIERMKEAGCEDDATRFEDLLDYINGEPELCRSNDTKMLRELEFDSFESLVDTRLEEFYDACDQERVWLGIGANYQQDAEPEPDTGPTTGGMELGM